jgi:hypothetical protein
MSYSENTPIRRALQEIQGPTSEEVAHRREILAQDDKELDLQLAQEALLLEQSMCKRKVQEC